MEYSAEMARLEEFVEKLLNKYNSLKLEYHTLQEVLRQRESECTELKSKVLELSAERSEVGNKVSGLLDRIEQWENDQMTTELSSKQQSGEFQATSEENESRMKTY
nr:cell division protein ZapB [uncultured Desulfobulbus sp.]